MKVNAMLLKYLFRKCFYPLTIILSFILWIILTESGLKTSVWLIKPFLPGTISMTAVTGKWIDTVQIEQLKYQPTSPIYTINIKQLILKPYMSAIQINEGTIEFKPFPLKPLLLHSLTVGYKISKYLKLSEFSVNQLEGTWNNMPLNGYGKIRYQQRHLQQVNLWVTIGENSLKISQDPQQLNQFEWNIIVKEKEIINAELKGLLSNSKQLGEWHGKITQFNATSDIFGSWELREPCPILLSRKHFSLKTLQFQQEGKRDASGFITWDQTQGLNTQIDIPAFPLQYPKYKLQGNAALQVKISQKANSALTGDAKLTISPGTLILSKNTKHPRVIAFMGGFLQLKVNNNKFQGEIKFQENQNNILQGTLFTAPTSTLQPLLEQPLQGTLTAEYEDLHMIAHWIPQISRLKATLSMAGTLGGTLKKPTILLNADARNISFYIPKQAIQVNRFNARISGTFPGKMHLQGTGYAGNGEFSLNGIQKTESFSSMQLELSGKNMQIYDTSLIQVKASPDIKLYYINHALYVEGTVRIMDASVIIKNEKNTINLSKDIVFVNNNNILEEDSPFQIIPSLYLVLENRMHFKGYGLEGIVGGKLSIEKRPDGLLSGTGRLTIKEGKYRLQGATRYIYRGYLLFPPGTLLMDPTLDIRILQRRVDIAENKEDVGIYVQGTLQKPFFNPYSSSNLQSNEILSRLGFGNTQSPGDESQRQLLSQTAFLLAGSANPFVELFQSHLELEEFNIESRETQKTFNTQGGTDTVLVLGKSLSKKLYLQYLQSILEPVSTVRLKYSLSPRFSTSVETGTEGLGGDLTFSVEKN